MMNTILGGLVVFLAIIFAIVLFYAGYKIGVFLFGFILSVLVYIFPKWRNGLHTIVSITLFVSALLIMNMGALLVFGIGMFAAFIFTFPERWFELADALFIKIVIGDKN